MLIGIISLLPSIIGNLYHFKIRLIKDLIRITLGIGLGLGLYFLFHEPDLITKGIIIIFGIFSYYIFKLTRNDQHSSLCAKCTAFSENICVPYKKAFDTEGAYSRILSDYVQKKLSSQRMMPFGLKGTSEEL